LYLIDQVRRHVDLSFLTPLFKLTFMLRNIETNQSLSRLLIK